LAVFFTLFFAVFLAALFLVAFFALFFAVRFLVALRLGAGAAAEGAIMDIMSANIVFLLSELPELL
jgi:hypothetical protein